MNNKFINIPSKVNKKFYLDIVKNITQESIQNPSISGTILHGTFPGDLGVSDIDIVLIVKENKKIDLYKSVYQKIKQISPLIDLMIFNYSVYKQSLNYINWINLKYLYWDDDFNKIELNSVNTSFTDIGIMTTLIGYTHKIKHIMADYKSGSNKLRRSLLHFKSVFYSYSFIANQFNNENYLDLKSIQKELIFLRKNWSNHISSKYFFRYYIYRKLLISQYDTIINRYSVLLKNKINLRNKLPLFVSNKIGIFINKRIYPLFIQNLIDFILFQVLRKKNYLLMPVPQEIINFFYIVQSYDKKVTKRLKGRTFWIFKKYLSTFKSRKRS